MKDARRSVRLVARDDTPGVAARSIAADMIDDVLRRRRRLDELFDGARAHPAIAGLGTRDRALVRAVVGIVLRRLGSLRHVIGCFLERGLPRNAPRAETALLVGAAQILFLDVPDHAAVDLAVRLAQADHSAVRYAGLVNAVLRRIAREGAGRLKLLNATGIDTPQWLLDRWRRTYGEPIARAIALAHESEPALDLTVKDDHERWARGLGGRVILTGTVRLIANGPVTALPGFAEGAWWVQDAAASLPARLFGPLESLRVADLCAAPGGKTAQLAAAGARVTAIDRAAARLGRLKENFARLSLAAEFVCADVLDWTAEPFDAVLLDAPCSSTGTIRRHPDVSWLKRASDIAALAQLQRRLLERAVAFTKRGGTLVYCTCSLEPEEGEDVISNLLAHEPNVRRAPIAAAEVAGRTEFITKDGDLRTLPCHFPDPDPRFSGVDGFYAARLVRQ